MKIMKMNKDGTVDKKIERNIKPLGVVARDSNRVVLGSSVKGVEAFTFDMHMRWPLSLVISRKALTKYQLLFRHFMRVKIVSNALSAAWNVHKRCKELDVRGRMHNSYCRLRSSVRAPQATDTLICVPHSWNSCTQGSCTGICDLFGTAD